MSLQVTGQVGPSVVADGVGTQPFRQGKAGEIIAQQAHGRYYESCYRASVYSGGMGLTAINNATYTSATLGPTCTPILGVYNPIGSTVNLVICTASLGLTVTAVTATGPGAFVWATSITTASITTGSAPFNRKTFLQTGGTGRDLCNVALTGLTPNLTVRFGSCLNGGMLKNISSVETAVGQNMSQGGGVCYEPFDGSVIVPPGGVLALLATTTPAAHSAVGSLVWEEVPL